MTRLALIATVLLAACGSDLPSDDDTVLGPDDGFVDNGKADGFLAWTGVGRGVAYQRINTGNAILIAYGGYSAKLGYSAAWATELVDARLGARDVGHVYAVQGPADAGYNGREIGNTKLRAHLKALGSDAPIYVVAHSSGSYVAHEMLGQLHNAGDTATLARIAYADLDGGGSGLTDGIVASLDKISFVYARDPVAGSSENNSTAKALGADYAPHATTYEVTVPSTGCNTGAGWCLHDVLVTHRPHNPQSYDLARDYTDFVGRPPTIEYFDALLPAEQPPQNP